MDMDLVGRFVIQGVHMLFEEEFGRASGKEARRNNPVFIGRDLNAMVSIWGYGVFCMKDILLPEGEM